MRTIMTAMLLSTTVLAADLTTIPHVPAGRWRVEAGAGDEVKLTETVDVLVSLPSSTVPSHQPNRPSPTTGTTST